ncbi:hypothetical protein [Roseibium sediminis]|uniref:hypothetical protein n=1 Tax=Roseibium sediminis TaxID=1775174 RepID=UPI00123E2676|nr:hypothetical protein [Roseibium sediminis]
MTNTSASELAGLGLELASIISNEHRRDEFTSNPATTLPQAGLPEDVAILADTADMVHLVIPAKVDEARVALGDEAYFEELGRLALGACVYHDLPE